MNILVSSSLTRGERFKDARQSLPKGERSMQAVKAATGISESMIKDLEDDEKSRDVGYSNIMTLAKHYGVSIDWLLCRTNIKSPHPDFAEICRCTGLTEDAIHALTDLQLLQDLSPEDKTPRATLAFISMLIAQNSITPFLRKSIDYAIAYFNVNGSFDERDVTLSFKDYEGCDIKIEGTTSTLLGIMRNSALNDIGAALDCIREKCQQDWSNYKSSKGDRHGTEE